MKKIYFLVLMTIIHLSCSSAKAPIVPERPNIILINVDDLGWKDLAFMGSSYYETPNIDQLASEGLYFTQAYAGAANCAPSRACLISGLNTPRHGIYTVGNSDRGNAKTRKLIPIENTEHLNDTVYTLPKMLKKAGYVTGNFGKWHVNETPETLGIDYNRAGSGMGNPGKKGYFAPYNVKNMTDGPEGEYLTDRLGDEAVKFVNIYKDTTFFLYLPFYSVHTPIMGKPDLVDFYKNKKGSDGQDRPDYAAMVTSVDQNVGKLLREIEKLNLEENTLILLTSDNGGIRAISHQDPLKAGKGSYYEGGIRVPMIAKWSGHIKPEANSDVRITNLDIYPTLQAIVSPSKMAKQLDGNDLSPILFENKTIAPRDLFFHFPIYLQEYSGVEDGSRDPLFRTRPGSVIISGDWKLHEYFEDGSLELYNLLDDPGEEKNLAKTNPAKTKELLQKLKDWRKHTNAPVPTKINEEYDAAFEADLISKKKKK